MYWLINETKIDSSVNDNEKLYTCHDQDLRLVFAFIYGINVNYHIRNDLSGSQRGGPWSPGALKFLLWSPEPDRFTDWSPDISLLWSLEPRDIFNRAQNPAIWNSIIRVPW